MKRALLLSLCVIASTVKAELDFTQLFANLQQIDWNDVNHRLKAWYRSLPHSDDIHGHYNTLDNMGISQFDMDITLDHAVQRTLGIRRKLGMKKLGEGENGNAIDAATQENGMIA